VADGNIFSTHISINQTPPFLPEKSTPGLRDPSFKSERLIITYDIMTFHPPSAYVPTNTARTTSPSLTDFPTLGSAKSTSARSTSEMISASHLTSTSDTEKMPNIPPIGTERTSPTTAMQPRLYGKDINAGRRDSSNPGHGLGLEITTCDYPSEAIEDTSTQQGQYLWQQLQHLKQQQQGSHQAVPYALPYEAQLQQQSYAEEAAQYLKKQQDEIALRHAEDLATGRAQPSGEGGFHPPPGPSDPTNTTVFVGGLHHNVTEPELFKFFQPFGQICYVCLPTNQTR